MSILKNKKVLLIAPKFFGYENSIINEFINFGAGVDFLPDRFFDSPLMTAVTKLKRKWVLPFVDNIYRKKLNDFGNSEYDIVFVINGQTLSKKLIHEMRKKYKNAKFILYMWDSVRNREGTLENLESFDFLFSFDKTDSKDFSMYFRPLFFVDEFKIKNNNVEPKYDLSFIGTAHSDRYYIVKTIFDKLPLDIIKYRYLFLQAPWVFYYYKFFNPFYRNSKITDFNFSSLNKVKLKDIFLNSRVILDIEHPNQTGLTIRTLESIGSEKKLITTNSTIKDYDFYSEKNILIIDRKDPLVELDFIITNYDPIDVELYEKYSIKGWLNEILANSVFSNNR